MKDKIIHITGTTRGLLKEMAVVLPHSVFGFNH
jgi:hypothetical protein